MQDNFLLNECPKDSSDEISLEGLSIDIILIVIYMFFIIYKWNVL